MLNKQQIDSLLNIGRKSGDEVIIFSEQESSRIIYTCNFIFNHVLKCPFRVEPDKTVFSNAGGIKINYSYSQIDGALQVKPSGLLSETGIQNQEITFSGEGQSLKMFFNRKEEHDIFSSVFYMISRYEEWGSYKPDSHHRFELQESILYKHKSHLTPVTDRWIIDFKQRLENFFNVKINTENNFRVIATIDVDNLYAYRGKGFLRRAGATIKDLLKGDFNNVKRRSKVISGKMKDPFDIYESFSEFCLQRDIPIFYFFLLNNGNTYDRTVDFRSGEFEKVFDLIKKYKAVFGIHPGYNTSNPGQMHLEMERFKKLSGNDATISRQHYLKFNIRKTPALLIKEGIVADFSMGFASGPGFRAGTSFPFHYYDFDMELERELLFVPFCAMDGAYFVYSEQSPASALQSMNTLKNEVKAVNGLFITVFHERTFAPHLYGEFSELYRQLLSS